MSFATCQPLMNSSPSALKQPEALQERQAGAEGGGTGKGGGQGPAPSSWKLWWKIVSCTPTPLKSVWCCIHLKHIRAREPVLISSIIHENFVLFSHFLPKEDRLELAVNSSASCLLFFLFIYVIFLPWPHPLGTIQATNAGEGQPYQGGEVFWVPWAWGLTTESREMKMWPHPAVEFRVIHSIMYLVNKH